MKTLLSASCFFITVCFSLAQTNFEGVIKWSIKMTSASGASSTELTEKQKAELKTGITQMESQLNDPQMKALFDSNPSMKATIEKQLQTMKAMQGDGGTGSLMPKYFTIKMKDGNSLTTVDGGARAIMGDILYQKATDKTYYIKQDSKTYSVAPKNTATTKDSSIVTVVATTETKKILTYTCTKYIVTISVRGEKQTMHVWATKDLKQYDVKVFHNSNISGQEAYSEAFKKIDGIPLGMEMNQYGQSVTMEVIELKNTTLLASEFIIPAGFKEVPFGQ